MAVGKSGWQLAFILSRRHLLRTGNLAMGLAFMAILVFVALKDSVAACPEIFIFLVPYILLFSAQDLLYSEIYSGALENVLFLNGAFRDYLRRKTFLVALLVFSVIILLFLLLALLAWISGHGTAVNPGALARSLLAAGYFYFLAAYLGHFLKGASNVLVPLVMQLLLFLVVSFNPDMFAGPLEFLDSGKLNGLTEYAFAGLALIFLPNLGISGKFTLLLPLQFIYLAVLILAQLRRLKKLEVPVT